MGNTQSNELKDFLNQRIKHSLSKYNSHMKGNHLGKILEENGEAVADIVVPNSAKKYFKSSSYDIIQDLICKNKITIVELWNFSKSVSNTMRPRAGHTFTFWVANILNEIFQEDQMDILAITKGPIISSLKKRLVLIDNNETFDLKPDIDIVVYNKKSENILAIISCKTTLAERVIQTIRWREYVHLLPSDLRKINIFLVTAWETFSRQTEINRVSVLDGVYCCSEDIIERGKIKKFDKLAEDLKKLNHYI